MNSIAGGLRRRARPLGLAPALGSEELRDEARRELRRGGYPRASYEEAPKDARHSLSKQKYQKEHGTDEDEDEYYSGGKIQSDEDDDPTTNGYVIWYTVTTTPASSTDICWRSRVRTLRK